MVKTKSFDSQMFQNLLSAEIYLNEKLNTTFSEKL